MGDGYIYIYTQTKKKCYHSQIFFFIWAYLCHFLSLSGKSYILRKLVFQTFSWWNNFFCILKIFWVMNLTRTKIMYFLPYQKISFLQFVSKKNFLVKTPSSIDYFVRNSFVWKSHLYSDHHMIINTHIFFQKLSCKIINATRSFYKKRIFETNCRNDKIFVLVKFKIWQRYAQMKKKYLWLVTFFFWLDVYIYS